MSFSERQPSRISSGNLVQESGGGFDSQLQAFEQSQLSLQFCLHTRVILFRALSYMLNRRLDGYGLCVPPVVIDHLPKRNARVRVSLQETVVLFWIMSNRAQECRQAQTSAPSA